MLHFFSFLLDTGWPQTLNFNRATKNSFLYKLSHHLSSVIITLLTTLAQYAFLLLDQEEHNMVSSSLICYTSSLELQWDGLRSAVTAKSTKLMFLILRLMRIFQFIKNALMKMTDHGLSKKRISLEATVFKLFSTLSTKLFKITIKKIRTRIFKELTPITFLETFFTLQLSNTLLPILQTETIILSIKMRTMATIKLNLI